MTGSLFAGERYEFRGSLGTGGFVTVLRAWDTALHREVAFKSLLPHLPDEDVIRHRFLAEARALAGLRHPNIVTVHDVGEFEGRPYFTMELIDGETLARRATSSGLPAADVIRVVSDLANVLDAVHRAGFIHRDVKASNVMIDRAGRVVLMDFGVARSPDSSHVTLAGMAIGTPEAMAPEQVRGHDVGPAADIYALGVLTYRLLAGRPPFTGNTTAVLFAHVQEPPPPLSGLRPGLPDAVYRAVESALAKEPWQRPVSAGAFAAALSDAAGTTVLPTAMMPSPAAVTPEETDTVEIPALTLDLPVAAPIATTPERPARHGPSRLLPAAAAAIGILVLAVAGWAATRDSGTSEVIVEPPPTIAAVQLVTVTIAGDGSPGVFNRPGSVAVDATGRVYVADEQNHRIRYITPERTIATLAGSGSAGFADGQGPEAEFDSPFGIAVDSAGKVYVADTYNGLIRTITREGVVSTLAGEGTAGFADGPADFAQFSSPTGVAVDSSGNVYVADFHNHRVRKVLPSGMVTTLAGSGRRGSTDGVRNTAEFDGPRGVTVDAAGNVYVADLDNNRIRKVEPDGNVTTVAGSGQDGFADGKGAEAQFSEPGGVTIDAAGNLYVADGGNRRIRKITPDGDVTTVAGSGEQGSRDGAALDAQFGAPVGIALDKAGTIYVSDLTTHRVRIITPEPTR